MPRSLLHIGGGELQLPGLRWARAAGLDVVLTDARADAPGRALCREFHTVLGTDVRALTALARACRDRGPFAGAYCSNDFGLEAVAAIGAETGAPAATPEAVRRALDKRVAGALWLEADVPTPELRVVRSERELAGEVRALAGPCVVKPSGSSGSRGVRSVADASEAPAAFAEASRHAGGGEVLVQPLALGHHVDVNAYFAGGAFRPAGILDRAFTPPPHHVPVWGSQPSRLDEDGERTVYALVERAARALGIDKGPLKADVVVGAAGPVILELTPRFHGDVSTAHVTPLATGTSPIEEWFALLACGTGGEAAPREGGAAKPALRHAGWMAILPERRGRLAAVRGVDRARELPGNEGVTLLKRPGARIERTGDNTSVLGFLWATGRDHEDLERNLRAARAEIEVSIA